MIKEKLLKFLNRVQPITGRRVTEQGTIVNMADIAQDFAMSRDTFGQIQTVEYTPLVELKPLPGISVLRDYVVGNGTVGIVNGEIEIDGSLEKTSLYTKDYGRYLPGLVGIAGIGIRIPNSSTGVYEFGYGNGAGNRFGVEVNEGEWYTFIESAGVRWYINPRSNWDDPLDGTGPSGLNLTSDQFVLRMPFGWYGYLSVNWYFAISTPNGDRTIRIDTSGGREGGVSIEQPDLPLFAEATGGVLYVGGRQFGVFGRYTPVYRITTTPVISVTGVTTRTPIASFRVKDTTAWRGVRVLLSGESLLSTENANYVVLIDADLTGAVFGSLDDIPDNETALEIDTSATSVSGGYKAYGDLVAGGQGNNAGSNLAIIPDINIPRLTTVTIAIESLGNAADINVIFRAKEEW